MIEEIEIGRIASYNYPKPVYPKKLNFIYGSNGSGKTTLSNVLSGYEGDGTSIKWKNGKPVESVVFNADFVEKTFGGDTINGIFTLGEGSKEIIEFIVNERKSIQGLVEDINLKKANVETRESEIQELELEIQEYCWKQKKIYEKNFKYALTGYLNSKKNFFEKCFLELEKFESSDLKPISSLEFTYKTVFNMEIKSHPFYQEIDVELIKKLEQNELLRKKIVGSSQAPIGTFIEFIGNSDWIKHGIVFLDKTDQKCPFCMQQLSEDMISELEGFFDTTYEKNCTDLRIFLNEYVDLSKRVVLSIEEVLNNKVLDFDFHELELQLSSLRNVFVYNEEIINKKIVTPSNEVTLKSVVKEINLINETIKVFNSAIDKNNKIHANIEIEKKKLKDDVWRLIASGVTEELTDYKKEIKNRNNAIVGITNDINRLTAQVSDKESVVEEKESSITSVKPTIIAINRILKQFGFESFELAEAVEKKGTYKIIRNDGKEVNKTLSEGEYNFITFLYFYNLVYGNHENKGIYSDKVVVIDDPISSLDSNVMFIVTTLVKQIIDDCRRNEKGIKQVFILTHNVFFHKEASFFGPRNNPSPNEVSYFIIKKNNIVSNVETHVKNPIETSYDLLWREVRESGEAPNVTIHNTLRRILEYYFNTIGGMNYEKCINTFEDQDRIICKSLISTINDGSHYITDDLTMYYDSNQIQTYKRIFKQVFENMGHKPHYDMMMQKEMVGLGAGL